MPYKDLAFTSYLVLVDEQPLTEELFFKHFKDDKITKTKNDTDYNLEINKTENFATVYIQFGNPLPRPDNVINTETHQPKENPRQPNEYEPKQEFALFDFNNSSLWISNTQRKTFFIDLLKEIFDTDNVILKNVYNETEFINAIKKVEEIKFSALPNIFTSTNTLSKELTDEILGYGATIATLIMKYSTENRINDNLINRIKNLFSHKETYKSLVITGRDENNLGIIFNNELVSKRIPMKAVVNENEIYDVQNVFAQLIGFLKNDKKTI